MSVLTHCLPSGALGASELPVPNVSAATMSLMVPAGSKRGVVVLLHGLSSAIASTPYAIVDQGGILPVKFLTFATALVADGWIVAYPVYAEDVAPGVPCLALQADISADAGHGARYLAQMLHWWDHVVAWVQATYGAWPIVPFGMSWGGWHALQIAANRSSTIVAYGAHAPVALLSGLSTAFSTPADFTAVNTTGLDTTAAMLNAVAVPGILGWGTSDSAVGFTNQQAIYTAAHAAGAPITSNATADNHELLSADVTTYTAWFTATVDPLAPAVH